MERLLGRSRATGLRWAALSLVGLGVAAACSDDSSSPTEGPKVTGGEGGENASGSGGTAGSSAGKSTTGGTMGEVTAGATGVAGSPVGEGGMAGQAPAPTLGEQCTSCGATECTDTLTSCADSADCSAWLSCVKTCDSAACVAACDDAHVDAVRVYSGVYACLCDSCQSDCTAIGACEKKTCVDDDPLPASADVPATLAETGLYETLDSAGGAGGASSVELAMPLAIAADIQTYEPKYPLWADGAIKERHVYIPKCSTIDTTDMDHWKFPVGTRFWKTFSVDGKAVETRLMHRFGPGEDNWVYAAYQWDPAHPDDPTAALSVPAGVNADGLGHDIPANSQCVGCHSKLSERVLGFGAIQLSHATSGSDLTIKKISELGWLTQPAPNGFQVPGTPTQQAALGYLHGNCGGCHNQGQTIPNPDSPLVLRLLVGQTSYAQTDSVKTTVGVAVVSTNQPAILGKQRIAAMDPDNSGLLIRMQARGTGLQMPPLFTHSTKVADTEGGVKAVTDWINAIPQ